MNGLPPSASVATDAGGAKLHAPAAARNADAITALIAQIAPREGRALEIASGTGQHITAIAAALPRIMWHPSEIAAERIASIDAYVAEAALTNVAPAQHLDATEQGWSSAHAPYDFIHLVNLLHLIPQEAAATVIAQAALALAPAGSLMLYGPFKRGGLLTSDGDAGFDASLRAADPRIGYKDDAWVNDVLTAAGLSCITVHQMPANNLAFVARRDAP